MTLAALSIWPPSSRIEIEAAFNRFNLHGKSWEWLGVRHGAFGYDGRKYRLEILAPKSSNFALRDLIDGANLPVHIGQVDDDLILSILGALSDCRVASPCPRVDTTTTTTWYAALAPKADCTRSRFIVLHRQNA